MKLWLVPLLAAGLCAQDRPPKIKIITAELPNGLKMVMHEDHSRPVINLQVWYHVGSKDEREGRTGFAHLFEHLMFLGSKNVGPEEHSKYVQEAGGQLNAYTTFDQTVYWETFPSNYLERMLWLEADRMASLKINDENFNKEREVVKEERRFRIENPPYGLVQDDLWNIEYQKYPYKHAPIGSEVLTAAKQINSFYGNVGAATGFAPNEEHATPEEQILKAIVDMTGIVSPASNPAAARQALAAERRAHH